MGGSNQRGERGEAFTVANDERKGTPTNTAGGEEERKTSRGLPAEREPKTLRKKKKIPPVAPLHI